MSTLVHVQRIDTAHINTDDHGHFAVTTIKGEGNTVSLFLSDHRQAKLVSAALHNDRAALRAMLAEPEPEDDERPDEPSPDEMRRMRVLYEAEKAAELFKPREEYEADLIDAGRGHLIRRE